MAITLRINHSRSRVAVCLVFWHHPFLFSVTDRTMSTCIIKINVLWHTDLQNIRKVKLLSICNVTSHWFHGHIDCKPFCTMLCVKLKRQSSTPWFRNLYFVQASVIAGSIFEWWEDNSVLVAAEQWLLCGSKINDQIMVTWKCSLSFFTGLKWISRTWKTFVDGLAFSIRLSHL